MDHGLARSALALLPTFSQVILYGIAVSVSTSTGFRHEPAVSLHVERFSPIHSDCHCGYSLVFAHHSIPPDTPPAGKIPWASCLQDIWLAVSPSVLQGQPPPQQSERSRKIRSVFLPSFSPLARGSCGCNGKTSCLEAVKLPRPPNAANNSELTTSRHGRCRVHSSHVA